MYERELRLLRYLSTPMSQLARFMVAVGIISELSTAHLVIWRSSPAVTPLQVTGLNKKSSATIGAPFKYDNLIHKNYETLFLMPPLRSSVGFSYSTGWNLVL